MEIMPFNSPVTPGSRLSSSGADGNGIKCLTTFGPFCGKKKPWDGMGSPFFELLDIPRLFGQENTYPDKLQNVELTVGDNTLYLSVKQIAAIGRRNGKNWQKLKVRTSTPESTTSDGKTPEGISSIWFYCELKDSEGDISYVCIKMYGSGTLAYTGALPYLDIGAIDTIQFHELVCQTVIKRYVLNPGEQTRLLTKEMTWDNLTCQIHYNGHFPGKNGLENAVKRVKELCDPTQLDVAYEPEFTPPQLLVYKVGTIPGCNLNPLTDGLLSPRPLLPGTTIKANLCFFKNQKISVAGANNPDGLKQLEETAKKLVQYFVDKCIVRQNPHGKFNTKKSLRESGLVNLDQYKRLEKIKRKEAEEKKHAKKLEKARRGRVPKPISVQVHEPSSKRLLYSDDDEFYVPWAHIEEPEPEPEELKEPPRTQQPEEPQAQQTPIGIPASLTPVNTTTQPTLSDLSLFPSQIIGDLNLNDGTEVLQFQCNESMFSERMDMLQIDMIDSQINGFQVLIDGCRVQKDGCEARCQVLIDGCEARCQVEMDGHQAQVNVHQAQIDTLQASKCGCQDRCRVQIDGCHDRCREEMDGHQAQMDGHQAQMDGHQAQMDGHQAQIDGHRAQMDGHQVQINTLQAKRDGCQARCQVKIDGCEARCREEMNGHQAQMDGHQARINTLQAKRNQLSGASGRYQTPRHGRPVDPRSHRGTAGTTPRPTSPDQVTEDSGRDSKQQQERSPSPPIGAGLGRWVKKITSHEESEDESSEDDASPDHVSDEDDDDDDAPAPAPALAQTPPPPNQDLLGDLSDGDVNAVEMVAEEADAEVQAALNEIQPDPIPESLIGTPGYPEWFDTKKKAQAGLGFYRTKYGVPRCGRCANCNRGAGKRPLTCRMVITSGRKRKAQTSPKEKPPPKKKTPLNKKSGFTPQRIPKRTYTDLDGFHPFLNSVGKHRKITDGVEFWYKQTPNGRTSKHDSEYIVWDPEKESSIDLRDTSDKGFELKGSTVSHLRSKKAMIRYWERFLDKVHLTQQLTEEPEEPEEEPEEEAKQPDDSDDSSDDSSDSSDSDSDSDFDGDLTGGTDDEGDQTDPEPEQEQEPPSAPMQIDTAPKKICLSDFKPPSRGVRQNGKAPTQKEKETIRKAMVEHAGTKSPEDIADMLISDKTR